MDKSFKMLINHHTMIQSNSQHVDSADSLPRVAEIKFVRVVDGTLLGQHGGDHGHGGQVACQEQPPRGHVRRGKELVDVAVLEPGAQFNRLTKILTKSLMKNSRKIICELFEV